MAPPCPTPTPRLFLGPKANEKADRDFYRSSILEFASALVKAEAMADSKKKVPLEDSIPTPSGCRLFRRVKDQTPLLAVCDIRALRYRQLYGYVGKIKFAKGIPGDVISSEPPSLIADVVNLRWRFGSLREERYESPKYCRILSFTSTDAFPGRLQVLFVGDPISGAVDAANGEHQTAQLAGWAPISAAEWELRQPLFSQDEGFG